MLKLISILSLLTAVTVTSFVPSQTQTFKTLSALKMNNAEESCPEIPINAQMDPKYDTAIIALG
jgi:hypothetical protein